MPVPLAVAAPAAVGAFAYLNAKTQLWYDKLLVTCDAKGKARLLWGTIRDRLNLFYLLESRANSWSTANKVFFWFEGQEWTYAQTYDTVLRYGTWMRKELGVKPNDIVAVDFQNSNQFVFIWLGLWSIGARPAFINYNLTGAALVHCLQTASVKVCLVDPNVAASVTEDVRAQSPGVTFINFDPSLEARVLATTPERADDSTRAGAEFQHMSSLVFTSGTTGMPKPAIVSWGKCYVGGTYASTLMGRGNDIISALVLSFTATLFAGSTQAIGRKFSTKFFWKEVRESKATNIQYVGETLRYLLAAPPQYDPVTGECLDRKHNVKQAFGNGLRPDVWDEFKERFGVDTVVEFYAATEGPFGTWNVSSNDFTKGAMGRHGLLWDKLTGLSTRVIALDEITQEPVRDPATGFCKKVNPGEPGEGIYKLPPAEIEKKFQGYHGNPKATESKLLRDVFTKGDVWFRSGDIVRWDNEGRVYFHDRIGDTFRWKSENVSTAEVSEVLGLHEAIREANVYGVQLPHHDGRAGCAAVFLNCEPNETIMRSVAKHVKKSLPRYAQPLFLRIVSGIGEDNKHATGTNKQQKHALREAGVQPDVARDEELGSIFWLNGDSYVPFKDPDWTELEGGRVKL
ncbi:acetyl-CoA synthetase-like protein [Sarocladium strictum]